MKKLLFFVVAAVAFVGCTSKNYAIEGNIKGLTGMVYLCDESRQPVDSTMAEDGAFSFAGKTDGYAIRTIRGGEGETRFGAIVFLEPGEMVISDTGMPGRKQVTGTPLNNAFSAYNDSVNELYAEYRNPETPMERRIELDAMSDVLVANFYEEQRGNAIGAYLLASELSYNYTGQELLDEIASFPQQLQDTKMLTQLKEKAELKVKTDPGKQYIEVVQPGIDGNPVTLSSVVENPDVKYVLLDFWASWCPPCRGEIPFMKKTYDAFHSKGFEIFGVSHDTEHDNWVECINENGLNWIHVSELRRFDNQAAKDYGVQAIPSNFLIDGNGTIIATNLRGDALYNKIAELLGE